MVPDPGHTQPVPVVCRRCQRKLRTELARAAGLGAVCAQTVIAANRIRTSTAAGPDGQDPLDGLAELVVVGRG